MAQLSQIFSPGQLVRHPDQPDWGLGQVQSAIGEKVSVTFENAGKRVVNTSIIELLAVFSASDGSI